MKTKLLAYVVLLFISFFVCGNASNYIVKATKHIPRIGRATNKNNNIDEMGKFFMKVSKSVPRIGRRNEVSAAESSQERNSDFVGGIQNRGQNSVWNDIAYRFEYEPELFAYPEVLKQLEENLGEMDKVQLDK